MQGTTGLRVGGVAALVAALVLTGSARDDAQASESSQKQVTNGTIAVEVVNTAAAADRVTHQFHTQGIDVAIETVPASPQFVGTWVYSSFSENVPQAVVDSVIKQTQGYTATIELPASFPGWIHLGLGRATAAGEELVVGGQRNALAPGGRLDCIRATGQDPALAKAAAERLSYVVSWADGEKATLRQVAAPSERQRVAAAYIDDASPNRVQFIVATPGTVTYDVRSRLGYSPEQWRTRMKDVATEASCDRG